MDGIRDYLTPSPVPGTSSGSPLAPPGEDGSAGDRLDDDWGKRKGEVLSALSWGSSIPQRQVGTVG